MADKKKICFVTPFFYPVIGGVETHILETARELIKKGYEVEVITSDSDRKSRIKIKEETYSGIKIKRLETFARISFGEVIFPGVFKAVRESDADIFHFHGFRHFYNLAEFVTDKPCFITPHWPDYRGQRNSIIQLIIDTIDVFLAKKMLNRCFAICEVTELEKPWLISLGAKKSKIILTPNALPTGHLTKHNGDRFRKKYGLGKSIVVLSLSRIHKSKGIDQIISVAKYFPEIKFVIMGKDGGAEAGLKRLAASLKLKNLIFGGQVSDKEKMEAYAGSDIFCAPSHFEAFNISLLEAMSQGCAVISSNKGGMPWVSGTAGLTFVDGNLEDLKQKLKRTVENESLRKTMQKKSVERAKKFTWKDTAQILDNYYSKALKSSR